MEMAKDAGYRTGNVSTAEITDATPAGQMSHALARGCQGPV
jgi:alkaline phosphatase